MLQHSHSNEKEQFRKLFEYDKVDRFEERFDILKVFLKTERHVTLPELLELFSNQNIVVDSKFVKETLKLMCKYGFARKHHFNNGDVRYEHMHLGQHHDHMICVKCNDIFEFRNENLEQLQVKIAKKASFHVLQHKMELYGICSSCMTKHGKPSYLSDAQQGENLIIDGFIGCKKYVSRLSSIGLRIGDRINVIANSGRGQLVISFGYRRLILCRKFAHKILVTLGDNNKN